jgi:hypothetical protein
MIEQDFEKFQRAFVRLAGLFRLRLHGDALDELTRSYFKILQEFTLADVFEGAKRVVEKQRAFPKPIDWLRAIPKPPPPQSSELVMTDDQAEEWQRAERLRYDDAPCGCSSCVAAGVSDKPVRFVPEFTADGRERRLRNLRLDRVVTAGHWAHGTELAGYYRAKAAFYDRFHATLARKTVAPVRRDFAGVTRDREPGEEG